MFDEGDLLTPTSTPRTPVQAEGYSTPPDAGTAMHAAFSLTPMKQCHSTRKRRNSGGESPSKRGPGTPTVSSPPHAGMGNWQLPPAPQARTHRTAVPLRSSSPVPFGGSCSTASLCVSRNDSDAMAQQWGGSFTNCTPEEPLETQDSFTIAGLNRIKPRTLDPSIATVYDVHSEDSDGSDTETESSSEEDPDCSRFAEDLVELCELGRGSYGVVYKVRHVLDQQIYAVKKGHRPVAGVVRKENCLQEVYSLAALPRCLHIIKYHDCWFEQRCLHIRFEYCEGGTIASVPPTAWTYDKLLTLFFQMSTGLKCLHQENIVHLDVKPENVFITEASGETVYKLGDFGLVRKIQRQTGTNEQWLGENHEEGDSRYLCQAFLRGTGTATGADVFSLGATIYEVARGVPLPTQGDEWENVRNFPAADLEGRYPEEFCQLIKSCMHKDPYMRPTVSDICENSVFEGMKEGSSKGKRIAKQEGRVQEWRERIARHKRVVAEGHSANDSPPHKEHRPQDIHTDVPRADTTPPERSSTENSSQGLSSASTEMASDERLHVMRSLLSGGRTLLSGGRNLAPVPPPFPIH